MKIQTEPFRKVTMATAIEICRLVELSAEARAFLLSDLSPQGFLSLLIEAELMDDAIRFLAFSLPIREAIWWACIVAHNTIEDPTQLERTCLECTAVWVYEPSEEGRRACMRSAEASKFEGAEAYAALSVFWSGGSLSPEGLPEVPADPRLGPIGVGASILLAITRGKPTDLHKGFETALSRGVNIANGGNGWIKGDHPIKPKIDSSYALSISDVGFCNFVPPKAENRFSE